MPFSTHAAESIVTNLQFALLLRDGLTQSDELLGDVTVKGGAIGGLRRESSGAFVFFALKPGPQVLSVRSADDTPYYQPLDVAVIVPAGPAPASLWPAFPDVTKADPSLTLGDPGQTAAYRDERAAATILPSTAYPFPEGATLIRGTVTHAGRPLALATVQQVGSADPAYTTGADGQFVLFWRAAPGIPQSVTVKAIHAGLADVSVSITVVRGLTVSAAIDM
jgi:hypothetical protein